MDARVELVISTALSRIPLTLPHLAEVDSKFAQLAQRPLDVALTRSGVATLRPRDLLDRLGQ